MKFSAIGLLTFLFCLNSLYGQYYETSIPTYTDQDIQQRLSKITSKVVPPRFDRVVRSYIDTYTRKKRDKTEAMLGRTVMYFPLFEKLLLENDLPIDLKYLSIVESALNPEARSRSGAVGLWQFMTPTARENGLQINRYVDERKDPEKATKAAMRYLRKQFHRFGNWELALAAYNGGPGRVNRAIKRGRSKNFWRIRRHLPRETRNYVPAFIAATYIANFYHDHNLTPRYPEQELQATETIRVYQRFNLAEIAALTGTPEYFVEILNPAYKRGFIPAKSTGHNLTLPVAAMAKFKQQYQIPDSGNNNYIVGERINAPPVNSHPAKKQLGERMSYTVVPGDDLMALSRYFYCNETDIMRWNRLTSRQLRPGQRLTVYISKENRKKMELLDEIELIPIRAEEKLPDEVSKSWRVLELPKFEGKKKKVQRKFPLFKWKKRNKKYIYHKIRRGESLVDIAERYNVSLQSIQQLNDDLPAGQALRSGMRIKVKKKK